MNRFSAFMHLLFWSINVFEIINGQSNCEKKCCPTLTMNSMYMKLDSQIGEFIISAPCFLVTRCPWERSSKPPGSWCAGSLHRQVIRSHGIGYLLHSLCSTRKGCNYLRHSNTKRNDRIMQSYLYVSAKKSARQHLTHCGLVTPYGDRYLGHHWLR